jgi:hypothetical protein
MLGTWLHSLIRVSSAYKKFDVFDIDEHQTLTPQMEEYLQRLLIEARLNTAMLQEAAKTLGWKSTEELLLKPTLPEQHRKRAGDFGETITNALLIEMYGYSIPVPKLHFAISDEQSPPGTDTIAIKTSGDSITELCYVESKLRTKNDKFSCQAAVQGYEQLKKDYLERVPNMISFMLARLFDDKNPLFNDFLNYVSRRQDLTSIDRFRIGLIWEQATWDEKVLDLLEEEVDNTTPKLAVQRVRVRDLQSTVKRLYDNLGVDILLDE